MRHRTFFWFILPSALLMLVFIALPVISVAMQSLYVQHDKVMVAAQTCTPFGCTNRHTSTPPRRQIWKSRPLGKFNGLAPISTVRTLRPSSGRHLRRTTKACRTSYPGSTTSVLPGAGLYARLLRPGDAARDDPRILDCAGHQ